MIRKLVFFACAASCAVLTVPAAAQSKSPIVQDAEYYVLEAQNGKRW